MDHDRGATLAQARVGSQLDGYAASAEQTDGEDVVLESSSTRHVLDDDGLPVLRRRVKWPNVCDVVSLASTVDERPGRPDRPGRWTDGESGRVVARSLEPEGLDIL